MKRYRITYEYNFSGGRGGAILNERDDGEVVLFSDVEETLVKLAEAHRELNLTQRSREAWAERYREAQAELDIMRAELIKSPPKGWWETLSRLQNNTETFGPHSEETARVAIECCMNALEELEAEQQGEAELVALRAENANLKAALSATEPK